MAELPQFVGKANFLFPDDRLRPTYWLAGGSVLSLMKGDRLTDAEDLARPALGDAVVAGHGAHVLDRLAPLRRARYLPEAASRRTALSSSASASRLWSRAFPPSSRLRRLARSGFRAPYSLRRR
jgi:hypothetical protein